MFWIYHENYLESIDEERAVQLVAELPHWILFEAELTTD